MDAPFRANNTEFAYQLHYHFGFRTRRCVPVFQSNDRKQLLTNTIHEVCKQKHYHLLEVDVDGCWTRLLLSLRPEHSPAKVVQSIKANTSRAMFVSFPEAEVEMHRRSLWSRGYYVRGVGDITHAMVQGYIAKQRAHHKNDARLLAEYRHPNAQQFFDLRPFDHCVAEYNCHFVCTPIDHVPAIDAIYAQQLVDYVLQIASTRQFDVISLAILEDHIHLFAALRPSQSPDYFAFALMNNTSYWFREHNPGAMKLWDTPGLWTPVAFIRTAGAVTTNVVRGHIRNHAPLFDD
jgi:putative transposase